jgi:hypothetical protein
MGPNEDAGTALSLFILGSSGDEMIERRIGKGKG